MERVEPPSIEERIDVVARETGVASTTLYNLAFSESSLNPEAKVEIGPTKGCPDGSTDRGIVMINDCYHREVSDEDAYNPDTALRWAAEVIKRGDAWREYSSCNCYSLARALLGDLPAMADLAPNGPPRVGSVAIFKYGPQKHVAVVVEINSSSFRVRESNLKPCSLGKRYVHWNDKSLVGFYNPL